VKGNHREKNAGFNLHIEKGTDEAEEKLGGNTSSKSRRRTPEGFRGGVLVSPKGVKGSTRKALRNGGGKSFFFLNRNQKKKGKKQSFGEGEKRT